MAPTDLMLAPIAPSDTLLMSKGFYLDTFYPAHVHYLSNALPAAAHAKEHPALLGGEAAMWTELEDRETLTGRIWPRAGAVAERLWSSAEPEDADNMYRRLFHLTGVLECEGVHPLAHYETEIRRLAGDLPDLPVRTLLDVLVPIKGYRRYAATWFSPLDEQNSTAPLHRVADIVLVDSQAKHEFRAAVAAFLAARDHSESPATGPGRGDDNKAGERILRGRLVAWSQNASALDPYFAQSKDLQEVAAHARSLAALSAAALQALDQLDRENL